MQEKRYSCVGLLLKAEADDGMINFFVCCRIKSFYYLLYLCVFVIGCSKQAPAWNEAVKRFADNEDVAFGDINLSDQQIRGM